MKVPALLTAISAGVWLASAGQAQVSVSSTSKVDCYTINQAHADGITRSLAPKIEATGVAIRPKSTEVVTAYASPSVSTVVRLQVYTTKTVDVPADAKTLTSTTVVHEPFRINQLAAEPTFTSIPYEVVTATQTKFTTITSFTVNPPLPTLNRNARRSDSGAVEPIERAAKGKADAGKAIWCQETIKLISTTESGPLETVTSTTTVTPRKVVTSTQTTYVTASLAEGPIQTATTTKTVTAPPSLHKRTITVTGPTSTVSTTTTVTATVTRALNKQCATPFANSADIGNPVYDKQAQATAYYGNNYDDVGCCSHVAAIPGALAFIQDYKSSTPGQKIGCTGVFLNPYGASEVPDANSTAPAPVGDDPIAALTQMCVASNAATEVNITDASETYYYGSGRFGALLQCGSRFNVVAAPPPLCSGGYYGSSGCPPYGYEGHTERQYNDPYGYQYGHTGHELPPNGGDDGYYHGYQDGYQYGHTGHELPPNGGDDGYYHGYQDGYQYGHTGHEVDPNDPNGGGGTYYGYARRDEDN